MIYVYVCAGYLAFVFGASCLIGKVIHFGMGDDSDERYEASARRGHAQAQLRWTDGV